MNKLVFKIIIGIATFTGIIYSQNVDLNFSLTDSDTSVFQISYNSDTDI